MHVFRSIGNCLILFSFFILVGCNKEFVDSEYKPYRSYDPDYGVVCYTSGQGISCMKADKKFQSQVECLQKKMNELSECYPYRKFQK